MPNESPSVDVSDEGAKLLLFERFLGVQQASWAISTLTFNDELSTGLSWTLPNQATLLAALALGVSAPIVGQRWRVLRALVSLSLVLASWPQTSNHGLLGTLLSVLLPFLAQEPNTAIRFFQRTLLVICFGAGVQKLLHGTWWSGSFLAYEVVHASRFEFALRWLLSPGEWTRLRGLRGDAIGTGPYVLTGISLWLARALVLLEVGLPVCALQPRLRALAHIGLLLLAISFALVARELLFGGLFIALNALVWPTVRLRHTLIAVTLLYGLGALLWIVTEGRAWA